MMHLDSHNFFHNTASVENNINTMSSQNDPQDEDNASIQRPVCPTKYTIFPSKPEKDNLPVIYSTVCNIRKLNGDDYLPFEIGNILSRQCFKDHHETIKSGQSTNIDHCLQKIQRYSNYDMAGVMHFRMLTVPPGSNLLWEDVCLKLLLIESRHDWGECRILPFDNAKNLGIRRIKTFFQNSEHYPVQKEYAGELDTRSRLDTFGDRFQSEKKKGLSQVYLASRVFPDEDLAFARTVSNDYANSIDVLKVGLSYDDNANHRTSNTMYAL